MSDDRSSESRVDVERQPVTQAVPKDPPRQVVERIGLALIALVLGLLFGTVAVAAWFGGDVFLAAWAAIGCLMTFWVGTMTLFRG